MDVHKNARLTPLGRERMVKMVLGGQTPQAVSEAVGVCPRTVRKWVKRYESEGLAGLQDRSSRPQRLHRPTPQPVIERIETLRRRRLTGQADRRRSRCLAGHGEPRPQAARPQQAECLGARRAGAPL
jgi:transposase-like protein